MEIKPQKLIKKYVDLGEIEPVSASGLEIAAIWESQYDDYSAAINYAVVREIKPRVVVEFGARTGRCTSDILSALIKNGGEFVFKSYEKDNSLRADAQRNLDQKYGKNTIVVGSDILEDKNIPDNIDYLFVDNSHDGPTTEWLFNTLLKKCSKGAIVQIHDIPLIGDYELKKGGVFDETNQIIKLHKQNKLPLKKLYWASEDTGWESSWWEYTG